MHITPASHLTSTNIWKEIETRDDKLKRLHHQSKSRTISTKTILVTWLEKNSDLLSDENLMNYDYVLYDEYSLLNWILGSEEAPIEYHSEVLDSLKDYAKTVRFKDELVELKYKDLI